MPAIFYDHLLNIRETVDFLKNHSLDPEEEAELLSLIDEIYHHQILNVILNHLPKQFHSEFVAMLTKDPTHPGHIDYLKAKVTVNIEEVISTHSRCLHTDLVKEITKSRRKK